MNRPATIDRPAADHGGIAQLADHLFRHETGKLVSVLTGIFGIDRLQLAEDVVQESLVKAMQTWPYYGVPKNPAAWLTHTAKPLALDSYYLFHAVRAQIPNVRKGAAPGTRLHHGEGWHTKLAGAKARKENANAPSAIGTGAPVGRPRRSTGWASRTFHPAGKRTRHSPD